MKNLLCTMTCFFGLAFHQAHTQSKHPPFSQEILANSQADVLARTFLSPQRIIWKSPDSSVINADYLLQKGTGQATFDRKKPYCRLISREGRTASLILDFGKEIQGGIQITTAQGNNVTRRVRLRFGESVTETNTETMNIPSGRDGSTNHHSMRDFDLTLPGLATMETGNTGFRFVRIDLLENDAELVLQEIRAVAKYRDIPYLGTFSCSDERLNEIWETGAYTVHLNMLDYIVDGIKRDRSVWSGDIHPQMMVINHVFGNQEVLPKSLDFLRDASPLPKFVNGIPTYSLWWIIMQHDWYLYQGDKPYLSKQKQYLLGLLEILAGSVDQDGRESIDPKSMRFIDWPSYHDKNAVHAAIQGMLAISFEKGAFMCEALGEKSAAKKYRELYLKMKKYLPDPGSSKQAASLLSLAGIMDAKLADEKIINAGGAKNFGAFFGYYMLQAQAKAGNYTGAMKNIRDFWGGMLDLGATTFWEEFDLDEAAGAGRIDQIVPEGKKDYHLSTGKECYIGVRRSLCHGWSAGPTAWLSENVLGITVLEPGAKKIRITPHLGDLKWAEGSFPTPSGAVHIKHVLQADGRIKSEIKAPKGVVIVKD